MALADWLVNVGASTTRGQLSIASAQYSVTTPVAAQTTSWITTGRHRRHAEQPDDDSGAQLPHARRRRHRPAVRPRRLQRRARRRRRPPIGHHVPPSPPAASDLRRSPVRSCCGSSCSSTAATASPPAAVRCHRRNRRRELSSSWRCRAVHAARVAVLDRRDCPILSDREGLHTSTPTKDLYDISLAARKAFTPFDVNPGIFEPYVQGIGRRLARRVLRCKHAPGYTRRFRSGHGLLNRDPKDLRRQRGLIAVIGHERRRIGAAAYLHPYDRCALGRKRGAADGERHHDQS